MTQDSLGIIRSERDEWWDEKCVVLPTPTQRYHSGCLKTPPVNMLKLIYKSFTRESIKDHLYYS